VVAFLKFLDGDLFLAAMRGLLEFNLHVVAEIRATLRAGGIAASAASAEELVEDVFDVSCPERLAEKVKGIVESARAGARAAAARVEGIVAVLVVGGALLRVAQCLVGFADLLELVLGGLVTWILVGVKLEGLLAIGLLEFVVRNAAADAEDFVIVALGHPGEGD
jgi:hypothetical protein